jgi:hypothetical protein
MTLQAAFNPISLLDVQGEFGGIVPISLNEYYAGGLYVPPGTKGYIPLTTSQSLAIDIPTASTISFKNFFGSSQKEAAGTQTFYSSGTFTGKIGYNSVTLDWFDNNGYNTQSFAQTGGTAYTVTIGAAQAVSSFGGVSTAAFDKQVFYVYGAVDASFYPRTNIYNSNALSAGFTSTEQTAQFGFTWNGTDYSGAIYDTAGFYFKDTYIPPILGLKSYFSARYGMSLDDDAGNPGEGYSKSVSITTFPSAAATSGSTYISYNVGRNSYYTAIDIWNNATGSLRFRNLDDSSGEGNYYTAINYTQPVWIRATWS